MTSAPAALKYLRRASGQTLNDVASKMGVHPTSVSRHENGKREPQDAGVVRRLAFAYLEEIERHADEARRLVRELI